MISKKNTSAKTSPVKQYTIRPYVQAYVVVNASGKIVDGPYEKHKAERSCDELNWMHEDEGF